MSISVGIGLSKNKDSYLAGKEAAYQAINTPAISGKGKNISIAFMFATVNFNPNRLLEGVKLILGNTPLVGSSGAGIITPSGIHMHAVAIMVVSSTKIKFAAACERELDKKDLRIAGHSLARNTLKALGVMPREIFILFLDGLIKNASNIMSGIKEALGTSLPLIGGSSADDLKFVKTYQFFKYEALTNSAVGVLVGQEAIIRVGVKHGWKPLGKPRVVTSSSGNVIRTIDNKPAISIYEEYFGKDNHEIKTGKLISLSIRYPLGMYLEGETEYLLRNAIGVGQDGSLICQGDVPEGITLKFMMGAKESALGAAKQAAEELKKTNGQYKHLGFALIFDSVARNRLLGRCAKDEIETIKDVLGDNIPFIGFYAYGEQAPLSALDYRGQSHFHNESIAIVGIGEK